MYEVHCGENVLTSTKGNLIDASHARSIVKLLCSFSQMLSLQSHSVIIDCLFAIGNLFTLFNLGSIIAQ